jgi:(R)-citramalyl-CoA lyase
MHYRIQVTDVAPRDGLQNEPEILPIATRVALIRRLLTAGVPRVEIGSFVNPRQVPQMAGTAEVASTLLAEPLPPHPWGVQRLTTLVPNVKGYELAVAAGLRHVRLVFATSEGLNQANFKRSVADSVADLSAIARRANSEGVGVGVAIGASFGCPFDGHVPPERVVELAKRFATLGVGEIVLADTTGMAVPSQVDAFCRAILRPLHDGPLITLHLHNTRNTGYANVYAALQAGIYSFDSSLGGIGGCPFAPRAVGNIATEDLVHMLNGMGYPTAIDLPAVIEHTAWLSEQIGKPLPALVGKAEPVYAQVTQGHGTRRSP